MAEERPYVPFTETPPGGYISEWEEGEHPFGQPEACPFCGIKPSLTSFTYNGPGAPPSYIFSCGHCGAEGPHSSGRGRGDHQGALWDAVEQWNKRALIGRARDVIVKYGRHRLDCAIPNCTSSKCSCGLNDELETFRGLER